MTRMSKVRLLDRNLRELIAAGEVVDRPSSALKELVENALDAGATKIEVELRRGGLELMRVTDNGCGIEADDVPTAFLRHATSKIREARDLDSIGSLGFRGEALAAICAVSRVRLVTRTQDAEFGTEYRISGSEEESVGETGATVGTSIYVNDIFYNTPARMKFLKNDTAEGNAAEAVIERLALSHPETAFTLIRERKTVLRTPGDGTLFSAVYAVLPKEVSDALTEVNGCERDVGVYGYCASPSAARKSRSFQFVFVNGRFVKSSQITAAVEQAYRNLLPRGTFPPFVLCISLPYEKVDVNVHPQKTQVRFSDERAVFGAVYGAVKNAVLGHASSFETVTDEGRPLDCKGEAAPCLAESSSAPDKKTDTREEEAATNSAYVQSSFAAFVPECISKEAGNARDSLLRQHTAGYAADLDISKTEHIKPASPLENKAQLSEKTKESSVADEESCASKAPFDYVEKARDKELSVVGELFGTYIVCEYGSDAVFIDKHAAHERLLFEELDEESLCAERQILLSPVTLSLPLDEKQALLENPEVLQRAGFLADDFGGSEIAVRETPTFMPHLGIVPAMQEMAAQLLTNAERVSESETAWLLHSVSCRAAIKAGHRTSPEEMLSLAKRIIENDVPKYCPHGRPVFFTMSRSELERRFGRG